MTKREELIASLNEAFNIDKERKEKERYRFESMTIDEHNVQRMLDIKDDETLSVELQTEKQVISGFYRILKEEKDSNVKKSANRLEELFLDACSRKDSKKIMKIYSVVKNDSLKLNMIDKCDSKRDFLLLKICDDISHL